MKTRSPQIIALVVVILLASGVPTLAQKMADVWVIGPRPLPASVDVSNVFRESLLHTEQPDVEAAKSFALETAEEWEAFTSEKDAAAAASTLKVAETLSVTVEADTIAGVNVYRVTPPEIAPEHANHLFYYIHGGAYVLNAGAAGASEAVLIARHLKIPVISIDYRMPPEYPFPAAVEDVVAVWQDLLENQPSDSIAMGGTSAGGGLTLASVHRFKELGLELPGALYAGTPWSDLTKTGDSYYINEGIDRLLVSYEGLLEQAALLYAGDNDLTNPLISPVYGDFTGFPPVYLISGTRDLFLSNTARVHRKLRRAGVEADLHVYEGVSHGDYAKVATAPESFEHFAELNAFVLKHLQSPLQPAQLPGVEGLEDIQVPDTAHY